MIMADSIDDILQKPFLERLKDDQQRIILKGKPRPPLILNDVKFKGNIYDKELWVTACDRRKTFYCWPCLLFVPDNVSEWTTEGYSNVDLLEDAIKEHSNTANHNDGLLKLQYFIRKFVTDNVPSNPDERNEACQFIANEDFFRKRLLNFFVSLLCHVSYPPPDLKEIDQYILKRCSMAVIFYKENEVKHFSKALDYFSQPEILMSYIATLSKAMKNMIKEEMQNSTYVSLIINEHSSHENGVLISIVFRYIKNEEVCERFVEFYFVSMYEDIAELILHILQDFEVDMKLIAFSFDSAMSNVGQMEIFVNKIHQLHRALFVPCYFHSFEKIIGRRLSQINYRCHIFFSSIAGMKDYLYRMSSDVQESFKKFVEEHFDYSDIESDYFKFIIILKEHKILFCKFFDLIKQNFHEWSGENLITAIGFRMALDDPYNLALLEIFFYMSPVIVKINDTLCSSAPEQAFKMCHKSKNVLNSIKRNDFDHIWDIICTKLKQLYSDTFSKPECTKKFYREIQNIFNEVIDSVIIELEMRIESLEIYYDYFSVCSPEYEHLLPSSRKSFPYFPENLSINSVALQEEINELRKKHPDLTGKTDHDMYKFLIMKDLQKESDLFSALQAILTVPCKPTQHESLSQQNKCGSSKSESLCPKTVLSKLDTINHWSRVYHATETFINNWSLLFIEQHFLNSLLASDEFCNNVYLSFEKRNSAFKSLLK